MRKIITIILVAIAALLAILGAVVAFVCYQLSDERLTKNTEKYLHEVFGTEVKLKSAELRPFDNAMALYGLNLKDRKGVDMLHVDTLQAKVNFWQLWHNRVCVYGFNLAGATAIGYKERKDTAANYQFAIDAVEFAGDSKKKKEKNEKEHKKQLFLDLRHIHISRTSAKWDVHSEDTLNTPTHKELDLDHLWIYDLETCISLRGGGAPGNFVGEMDYLDVSERNSNTTISIKDDIFDGLNKRLSFGKIDLKYQDKHLCITDLKGDITNKNGVDVNHLVIKDIFFENGIGIKKKPRPKTYGHFDETHVKVNVTVDAEATYLTADSLALRVNRISGIEHNSALYLDSVAFALNSNRDKAEIRNFRIFSGHNSVKIGNISAILPRYGKNKRPFSFTTSTITGHALLKELAYPLSPALNKFTTRLCVTTKATGNDKKIFFHNIHIWNLDKRLQIYATGHFNLPKHKGNPLTMEFYVNKMTAVRGIKDQIIGHFMLKKDGMKFIRDLGDVTYRGSVVLPFRRQYFKGYVTTRWGGFNVDLKLNSDTYYMNGTLSTDCFHLGSYLANPNLGDVALKANVKMDIASPTIAKKIHRRQGKIPAGTVSGRAIEASYKKIKIKNIDFNIISDAKTARGTLGATGKVLDLTCDFSFDDADIKHSLKVKPHIKMHNFVENWGVVKWFKKVFSKKDKKDKDEKQKDKENKKKDKDKKDKDKDKKKKDKDNQS